MVLIAIPGTAARKSCNNLPTLPLMLLRTNDIIIISLSRPWNRSIVHNSTPLCFILYFLSSKLRNWARKGLITPIDVGFIPHEHSLSTMVRTIDASVLLMILPPIRLSEVCSNGTNSATVLSSTRDV